MIQTALAWNETEFSADRDGSTAYGPQQPSYNDNDLVPLGAPTRGSTPVPSLKQPATRDEEDVGLQQALAASRGEIPFTQQEMGVISSGKTHFGPAMRSQYEPAQWAVTTLPGQEVMPDLEPVDRVNKPGEPRCLRPLPSSEYLPNLLTILHSIPRSRKALLMPQETRSSYGQDSEWWKGHSIRMPRIVSTVDLSSAEPISAESDEVIAEMQRLMALLDVSSRSYGSVDSLLRLDAVNNISSELPAETLADRVLHAWEIAASNYVSEDDPILDTFRSRMGTNDEDGVQTPYMRLMPLKLGIHHAENPVTLTEAINELLWDMEDPEESDFYIEKPSELLCIHVSRDDKSIERAGLIIPPFFYIDQYLKENVHETKDLRMEMANAKARVTSIDDVCMKLETFSRGATKSAVDASLLLDHTIGHFSGQNKQLMLEDRLLSGAEIDVDLPSPSLQHEKIAARLNAVYAGIKSKIETLKRESEKAKELLSRLWQSASEILPADSLKHRYWLRGVATKASVTYILRPRQVATSDEYATAVDEDTPEGMQWWRIEYDDNGTKISKTPAAQDDVIRAVELEHKEALVVYASDSAIAAQPDSDLPDALRDFIKKDDELFNLELQISTQNSAHNVNISHLEHHGRRGSTDSTMVNLDHNDSDPPPYDDQDPPAHEITLDGLDPDNEMEMVETDHEPLTMGSLRRDSDVLMMGMGRSRGDSQSEDDGLRRSMDSR